MTDVIGARLETLVEAEVASLGELMSRNEEEGRAAPSLLGASPLVAFQEILLWPLAVACAFVWMLQISPPAGSLGEAPAQAIGQTIDQAPTVSASNVR